MSFMMRPGDSLTLAYTKLRMRRIRLAITLVVMSLLFAGLVFLSIVLSGAVNSMNDFGKEGLGGRYIVRATPFTYAPFDNQKLVDTVSGDNARLTSQKVALAKKYGLQYEPQTDQTLPLQQIQTGPGAADIKPMANPSSPLVVAALKQQNASLNNSFQDFSTRAQRQGAIHTFLSTTPDHTSGASQYSSLQVLKDGKETYDSDPSRQYDTSGLGSITSLGWNQMDSELLKPFILPGQSLAVGSDGSIPVTAPLSAVEQITGITKPGINATSKQRLDHLVNIRRAAAGKTAAICYRNAASQELLQSAILQQKDIEANRTKKDYTIPALQYNLPTTACGATSIKKDVRTAEDKASEQHQKELDAITTPQQEPKQGIITVRIVGITADMLGAGDSSLSSAGLLSSILMTSPGQGWMSPIDAFKPDSLATAAQGGNIGERPLDGQAFYAEFPDLTAAKRFIENTNCTSASSSGEPVPDDCVRSGATYTVMPFGNNAGAIEDTQRMAWEYGRYVLLAIVIIAAVIMMGTLGKIIADSRRETAVFRALGARRMHIAQVYLTYTVLVSLLVAFVSFIFGSIGAVILDRHFSADLSVNAVLTYNAADVTKQFSLYGINLLQLGGITGLIILTSLLAALAPIILNMRRNPIKDMREE